MMVDFDGCINKIVRYCAGVLNWQISNKIAVIVQFVKFGIVGITNTVIYIFSSIATIYVLRPFDLEKDYIIANIVGFIISVSWSFYWNKKVVFKKEESTKRNLLHELIRVYSAYAFTGLIVSNLVSYLLIDIFKCSKYVVPLINSIVGIPINFVLNKLWVFRDLSQ